MSAENHASQSTGPELAAGADAELPVRLGRYLIQGQLGKGAFGAVYRAYDEELRRDVAIKVPHRDRIARPEDVEAYLAEARILAGLDHPHIVPVHDVGRTDDGLCYVVSKFIEGSDLKARIGQGPFTPAEAAGLIAAVAEALHHAHRHRLVHRDAKPANILLDSVGKPYVTDFGLALREEDFGTGPTGAGTPAYMSPDQAGGEGHRVDCRSDVFSLGVVFYELLTGQRPFSGSTVRDILQQILTPDPVRPARELVQTVPEELERICLKALAKRATHRYPTARDLATELRRWLRQEGERVQAWESQSAPTGAPSPKPLRIVPKGLRSFDAADADFFLELLPGPRDRDGLPESIRFWKTRVEQQQLEHPFSVGLLYGPSGCGKSSLVKAGLLPRLAGHVHVVYVEATPHDTESRLLIGLRRRGPHVPTDPGLTQSLTGLRRGETLARHEKLLLVVEQFEQWLHVNKPEDRPELVQALRQCDGERVQALLLVRDDFWMAVTRFMQAREVPLVEGHNSAAVDLFDLRHAGNVLAVFGQAFGALSAVPSAWSKDQAAFLDQAVSALAQDGKVIPVRLALFAEMVKGKPWTAATYKAIGGIEGVGVTFLEETFSAPSAPPAHRLHQKAAQAVLKSLLPEADTDIKGHMRSHEQLLAVSGYARRPGDFADLLSILDRELRLVTPTDPEGKNEGDGMTVSADSSLIPHPSSLQFYQLTHDYLVPSLRDWLMRKQKETRRGRAELRLAERTALWRSKSENRHLPSLSEWANIRLFTKKSDWTATQRQMMRKAGRYHALRGAILAVCVLLATLASWDGVGRLKAHGYAIGCSAPPPPRCPTSCRRCRLIAPGSIGYCAKRRARPSRRIRRSNCI
jgi:serine/threonine protein kinase